MTVTSTLRRTVLTVTSAGLLCALLPGAALAGPTAVGQVVALSGAVQAMAPGADPRTLSCNDTLYEGETLATSPGARVGILFQDVYAQLDTDSQLAVSGQSGGPELKVVSGAVRIVDTRIDSDAPLYVIATPHFSAQGRGGDTEVWVSSATGQSQSRICAREASVRISGTASTRVEAGTCVLATSGAMQPSASESKPSIGLAGTSACAPEFDPVAARFTPYDVAAPPFGLQDFPNVLAADAAPRDPCDQPGSGCSRDFPMPRNAPPEPPRSEPDYVDPDPDFGGCPPGAICNGPS